MPPVDDSQKDSNIQPPSEENVLRVLTRVGLALGMSVDRSDMQMVEPGVSQSEYSESEYPDIAAVESASNSGTTAAEAPANLLGDPMQALKMSARKSGIVLRDTQFMSVSDAMDLLREGCPLVVAAMDGSFVVVEKFAGRRIEASLITDRVSAQMLSRQQFKKLLSKKTRSRVFVAKKEFECDSISGSPAHGHSGGHHNHPTPFQRFVGLMNLDRRDVWSVILFAFIAGILALATPLAVESLVNVVSWGTYIQPLIVLALMLLTCLGLAGIMKVLQRVVVEMIQRRQFVRIVSDLAHRFPRANQASLAGVYPRELANRIFDIMTIQKATATLLLDGVSIVLTTIIGLLLLAFYHPFLLGFDVVLLLSMISITWVLGLGGIRTAINESVTKYAVAHWLQDVISFPTVFKTGGGEALAVSRANQFTTEYIDARQKQFRVVLRQVVFAVGLQVFASTALLALGGWLVIDGQLTLGQLVASELVVTVVVGAFAKAGKSLEKFYDLMAGIDKVGYLLDVPIDPRADHAGIVDSPAHAQWSELAFKGISGTSKIPEAEIEPSSCVAVVGDDLHGCSMFAQALAGLVEPSQGLVQIAGLDSTEAAIFGAGRLAGYVGGSQVFNGTLRENIDLARSSAVQSRIRSVIDQVGLADLVSRLPDGLNTQLLTDGFPLSRRQIIQLMIARAIVANPRILIVDRVLDELEEHIRTHVWQTLNADDAPWTLVVVTNRDDIAQLCDRQISVRRTETS